MNRQQQQEIAFMPNRDDYEYEFDNDAECVISSLFMSPDDGDLDRGKNMNHLQFCDCKLSSLLE